MIAYYCFHGNEAGCIIIFKQPYSEKTAAIC